MVVGGSKEARAVLFSVFLRVLVAYLRSYFIVKASCKIVFQERTYKIIVNKFVSFFIES